MQLAPDHTHDDWLVFNNLVVIFLNSNWLVSFPSWSCNSQLKFWHCILNLITLLRNAISLDLLQSVLPIGDTRAFGQNCCQHVLFFSQIVWNVKNNRLLFLLKTNLKTRDHLEAALYIRYIWQSLGQLARK